MAKDVVISGDIVDVLEDDQLTPDEQAAVANAALRRALRKAAVAREAAVDAAARAAAAVDAAKAERELLLATLESFGSPDGRGGRACAFLDADMAADAAAALRDGGLRVYEDTIPLAGAGWVRIIRAVMPK